MKIDLEQRNAGSGCGNSKNQGNMQVVQGLLAGARMNGSGGAVGGAGGYFEGGRSESMANNLYY